MRRNPRSFFLGVILISAALAACSLNERIADHAVDYNKTVEEANNSLLLLNILRAKDRQPMHFTALTSVLGRLTFKTTESLSLRIPFGNPFVTDAASTIQLTPSLDVSQTSSPSFTVNTLDKQEFMRGILTPIDISVFEFYWHQRWPPEVLLHLFIHDVDITYDPWAASTPYPEGAKILENDLLWVASKKGTSAGEPNWGSKPGNEVKDANITWKALYKADPWAASTLYRAGTTILANGLIWESLSGGTSGTVINEPTWGWNPGETVGDNGIIWEALDFKTDPWVASKPYNSDDTILANGLIWASVSISPGVSSPGEPDWGRELGKVVKDEDDDTIKWKALYKADPWAASTYYRAGMTILANGLIWESLGDGTSGTVINEPMWGSSFGDEANDGVPGNVFKWRALSIKTDPWAASTYYPAGTTILAKGRIWRSESPGGESAPPGKPPPKWGSEAGDERQDGVPRKQFKWKAEEREEPPVNSPPRVDPSDPTYDSKGKAKFESFQDWVTDIRDELDFGKKKTGRPIGAGLELDDEAVLERLVGAEEAKLRLVGIPKDKPTHYRLCKISTSVIFCVGECPKSEPEKDCREGTTIAPTEADDLAIEVAGKTVVAHLRSVQGMLYYLGEVLRYQEDQKDSGKKILVKCKDEGKNTIDCSKEKDVVERTALFDLTNNKKEADRPIIGVEYNDQWYYVPEDPEDKKAGEIKVKSRTKTALALVYQLLGLHRSSKELPTTTAVETFGGGS